VTTTWLVAGLGRVFMVVASASTTPASAIATTQAATVTAR
jgi:hypothetical protein